MRIFITGSRGLVGRNIADVLSARGHELLTPTHAELDLTDFRAVRDYVFAGKPDMVIHCAGRVGGIQANIKEPIRFLVDNLDMGRNVILAAYENDVRKLINFGSSCMYPRAAPNPLKEELILQGELEPTNEGYAIGKIVSQRLCAYIARQYPEFEYKTLMPCNLYGRYDKFDLAHAHMIPSAIHKVYTAKARNEEVQIWGTGNARREFMYAGDLADCVLYSIEHFAIMPEVMNVGIGRDYTINEYYQAVSDVIGFTGTFIHDESKPEGMKQKLVDVTRLEKFGWKSETSLHDGIKKTFEYYLATIGS